MWLSKKGFAALKAMEGYKNKLYNDSGNKCTIGYGHLVHRYPVGADAALEKYFKSGINRAVADALLRVDLMQTEYWVRYLLPIEVEQRAYDALVCFVFNIGCTAFKHSTLLKVLGERHTTDEEIFTQFRRWKYCNKKVIQGLINRREKEILLWKGLL